MDWSKINTANIKAAGNAVIFIAALFLSGAISFPPGTSEATQHAILAWDAWILTTVAGVNGVLHFMPDFTVPAPKAGAVAKALLIGLLALGAWSVVSPIAARAANAGADEVKVANGPVVRPPSPFTPSAPTPAAGDAAGPLSDLADLFASDFAGAASLATETSIKDGNGQACWTAFGPFGELVKAHPHVFTGKLATDLEAQRLLVMNARKLCDNVACQTVFTEAATAISKVTSVLPVSINVNVTPVNLFAKACADVPNIAVVAPTVEPTPTPTVSPTPTPSATGG
jgi:hypothetical protein